MQLTNVTASSYYYPTTSIKATYNYTAGSNNGKIGSATDAISGETVTYQYDSLNRLISASGSGWTQTQAYDGFDNLTGRIGTGTAQSTTISTPVNATTNQLSGYTYDANGNLISTGYAYDAENRISSVNAGALLYFYDAQNKRIWQGNCTTSGYCTPGSGWVLNTEQVNMYGADGRLIGTYDLIGGVNTQRIYFGGRLVAQQSSLQGTPVPIIQDRLGSVGKYYPYGEERNSPQLPNDQVKFATYTRDSATGNDYADQRYYYTSVLGRFMTADPYRGSMDPKQPQSLNRYAYVWGDPLNSNDPSGLCIINGEEFPDPCFSVSTSGGFVGQGGPLNGGHPSVAPLDPLPLSGTPLRSYALSLRTQVNAGRVRDCDALADFATAAGTGATAKQLEQDFGLLVPTDWRTQGIPSSNSSVGFVSPTSAFQTQYQNTNGDTTDQTHHFAAFFELGFQLGLNSATALAEAFETWEGIKDPLGFNQGDVNLAIAAASLGAQLKQGTILPDELGTIIEDTICSQ